MTKEITNFKGISRDPGVGKYPDGSLYDAVNCVRDRQYGSLTQRYGYSASLSAPTLTSPRTISQLDEWLTFPITRPSTEDIYLWFLQDDLAAKYVFGYPYWHNSTTKTSAWVNLNENKAIVFGTNPTVTGSPTNTIVAAGADTCTSMGLSTTANYYKNQVLVHTKTGAGTSSAWLITGYSVTADVPTFTLNNLIDTTGSTVTGASLKACDYLAIHRYFHKDKTQESSTFFVPNYTDPAGYSDDAAVRFSGGMGSTVGYKNIKYGHVNRLFFGAAAGAYQFTGSYADQAECFAPPSTFFTSLTSINANSGELIKNSYDHDFAGLPVVTAPGNWTYHGTGTGTDHQIKVASWGGRYGLENTLQIYAPVAGTFGTNDVYLPPAYLNNISAGAYTLKVKAFAGRGDDAALRFQLRVNDSVSNFTSSVFEIKPIALDSISGATEVSFNFTSAGTGAPTVSVIIVDVEKGYNYNAYFSSFSLTTTASVIGGVPAASTYKIWASQVYDGYQESELTYLSTIYVNGSDNRLQLVLKQKLGELNKFTTSFNVYCSVENGDTTLKTSTTTQPKYLVKQIPVDDTATTAWVFSTANGRFDWTGNIDGTDITNMYLAGTWEQNTGRTAANSTTCSYSIARKIAGRVFLAQDYDYYDAKSYTNRLRYTSFNSAGLMCPDIFPNLSEQNITTISVGGGTYIRNVNEFRGNAIIRKDRSAIRLTVSDASNEWRQELISDSVGGYCKKDCVGVDDGLMFYDKDGVYFWNGGRIDDVSLGRFKYFFRGALSATASNTLCYFNALDKTFCLIMDRVNSSQVVKIYPEDFFFVRFSPNNGIYSIAQTSDRTTYFATILGAAYVFDTTATDAGTAIRPYLETQVENAPEGMRFYVRSVRVGLTSSVACSGTLAVTLRGTNALLVGTDAASLTAQKTWTVTPDTTHGEYRFIVPPDVPPLKFFKVTVNSTISGLTSSAGDLSFHSIAYECDLRRSVGDVLEQ